MKHPFTCTHRTTRPYLLATCLLLACLLAGCSVLPAIGGGLVPESAIEADLRGKGLTEAQLEELVGCTQLQLLDIRDNPVSAEQFDTLSAALPGCDILWSVPLCGETFSSDSAELALPAAADADDIRMLRYFPNLTRVDATACSCYDALLTASQSRSGCEFAWNVTIGGQAVSNSASTLDLTGAPVSVEELCAALPYLPALAGVDLHDTGINGEQLAGLIQAYPNIRFEANLDVCGKPFDLTVTEMDLSDATAFSTEALAAQLPLFANIQTVDMAGQNVTFAEMEQLYAAYPAVTFIWNLELAGQQVSSADTELDFSGKTIDSLEEFSKLLAYLPDLQKVNLCDSNFTDEQMNTLCQQYPNVKFVWYVTVGRWQIRTDAQAFSTGNEHSTSSVRYTRNGGVTNLTTEDIAPLQYCTDLVALDIGHKRRIKDISVVANMPKLRFLIIAMEGITDISPIAACTELEYLETFQNNLTDITPLLSLKKLTHLNCSTNAINSIEVLKQMTQLERLWCIRCGLDKAQIAELQAALPDCVINTSGTHSTSNGWRKNDLYKEMQGLFELPVLE